MTILISFAQLFSDYLGKTNSGNSVWWAYVHRWLGALHRLRYHWRL